MLVLAATPLWAVIFMACSVDLRSLECTTSSQCEGGRLCLSGRCVSGGPGDVASDSGADRRGDTADEDTGPTDAQVDRVVDVGGDDRDRSDDVASGDADDDAASGLGPFTSCDITTKTVLPARPDECEAASTVARTSCRIDLPSVFQTTGTGTTVAVDFVLIEDGPVVLGISEDTDPDWAHPEETLVSDVWLPAFYIQQSEVTVEQFAACVDNDEECARGFDTDETGCNARSPITDVDGARRRHPMNCLTRLAARHFCAWLAGGQRGRLPTEAEWERAARGGCSEQGVLGFCDVSDQAPRDNRLFPWGDDEPTCETACWADNDCGARPTGTCVPGASSPGSDSPDGVADLAGNVAEWVADDWIDDRWDGVGDGTNCPETAQSDDNVGVVRGGSFASDSAWELRIADRQRQTLTDTDPLVGFRCVIEVP